MVMWHPNVYERVYVHECARADDSVYVRRCRMVATGYGEHHDVREAGCRPSLAAAATLHTQLRTIFCQLRYSCLSPRDLRPGEVKVTHTYK